MMFKAFPFLLIIAALGLAQASLLFHHNKMADNDKIHSKLRELMASSKSRRFPILIQLLPLEVDAVDQEDYINQLLSKTKSSQNEITHFLEKLKGQNLVSDYRSYSVSNTIAVEASRDAIEKLAKFNEVEEISPNLQHKAVDKLN